MDTGYMELIISEQRKTAMDKERRALEIEIASSNENNVFERIKSQLEITDEQLEKFLDIAKSLGISEYALSNLVDAMKPIPSVKEIAERLGLVAEDQEPPEKPEHPGKTFIVFSGGRHCGRSAFCKAYQYLQERAALYKRPKIPPSNPAKSFRQTGERDL